MEYIKKEELIIGEIYKADNGSLTYIMKATKDLENVKNIPEYCDFMKHGCFNDSHLTFTNATSEEKHWLNTCIKQYKFITFEEAMKTFIPEYVEWIDNIGSGNLGYQTSDHFKKNKIFKTDVELPSHGFQTQNWITHLKIYPNNYKPSTKEAYDAQFVVIEPLPQFKIIESIETITKVENNEGNQFFIGDVVISSNGTIQTIESFDYNKAKTNIIAFTNKQSILGNGIGIDKIEHYIEPKVEETLLEKAKIIEHSHDFKIGDKIKLKLDNGEFNFVFKIIKIEGNVLFFGNSIHSRVLAKNAIKVN